MIGYATLGTNDLTKAAEFYDALFAVLGASRIMEMEHMIAWGFAMDKPLVCAIKPHDGNPATAGNGTMIAITVDKPEQVDALHAKAIELGGANEGDPGLRGDSFYAGYFRDVDGNKLNAFCIQAADA